MLWTSVVGNYLINYLFTRGPKLQPFVTASLIQLLCRLTKFGWFDDDRFRDVVKESMNFLNQVICLDVVAACLSDLMFSMYDLLIVKDIKSVGNFNSYPYLFVICVLYNFIGAIVI